MGDEASNMQKILLCALLVAAAVAHDSPIPGKPLKVTFTGTPTQDIVDGDTVSITAKVFGVALGHVDFNACKDLGLTCPVKAGTASTWSAIYNIPSAAPGGVPITAEFTAHNAAGTYSCVDVDVVMGKPPAVSFAELALHAAGPTCIHHEDRHDRAQHDWPLPRRLHPARLHKECCGMQRWCYQHEVLQGRQPRASAPEGERQGHQRNVLPRQQWKQVLPGLCHDRVQNGGTHWRWRLRWLLPSCREEILLADLL